MAYPIMGLPRPYFKDGNDATLASGTVTIQDPADDSVKKSYPTAAKADSDTDGTSADVSVGSTGQPSQDLWGRDGELYKIIVKDTNGATVNTYTNIRQPPKSRRATVTFTSTDATPTVAESSQFITAGTTAITDFDNGVVGDTIEILGASSIVITHNSNISLRGETNFSMVTGDTLKLHMFNDQVWEEMGRSYAKSFTKFKTADETLTSSTLADDTHLKDWVLQPNTYYRFEGFIRANAAGAGEDLEFNITTDNGFVEHYYTWITVDSGSALTVDQGESQSLTTAVAAIDIDGTGSLGLLIKGFVLTHATLACNVDIQFACVTPGTVTVHKGSWASFIPSAY